MRTLRTTACLLALSIGPANAAEHWALQPVCRPAPPTTLSTSWPRTDIDRFILARLERRGLTPVEDADPITLVRRLYFNLVGLPPTPDQVRAFRQAAARDRSAAIERLVDRLLASPQYGEKWARHWLDLARFAESNGKDRDVVFPTAWRYRDYVIRSFNLDKPFNTLVREQIAGDLLPGAGPDQLIATAFLALGPKSFQEPSREKFAMDVVDEQIDVLSRSILGLTIACSRCHDHKFDAISTEDYYALAGILLSSDTRYGPGPLYFERHDKDTQLVPIGPHVEALHPLVSGWRGEIMELTEKVIKLRSAAYRIQRDLAGAVRERGLKSAEQAEDLAAEQQRMLAMRSEADECNRRRLALIRKPPSTQPAYTMAVLRSNRPPEDCAIRLGGVASSRGPRIARGALAIPGLPGLERPGPTESGRRQLADWLAANDNPLTARVMVNRVWQHLFGAGLVRTVDNFGAMGEPPSHPLLLDYLAAEFVADGWSIKRLIRRLVLSRSWQLASRQRPDGEVVDPDNRLVWRANFRRLDVEAFRDSVLAVSGQLIHQPRRGSLFQDVYAGTDYGEPNDHRVNFDDQIAADQHRTVYLPIARNQMPEFLGLFDFADPTAPTGARNSRTIPAQALYLLNNPFMERQAREAARRVLERPEDQRLEFAWLLATSRSPGQPSLASAKDWLERRSRDGGPLEAWTDLMQMLFASAQFRYIE